eukprot:SAG31_NODE_13594_length_859_cov_0.810526_2_plen_29_part_01
MAHGRTYSRTRTALGLYPIDTIFEPLPVP